MPIVNGQKIECGPDENLLSACLNAGIYIPHICYHPAIPTVESGEGCGLCKVVINGNPEPVNACMVRAVDAGNVITDNEALTAARQKNLARILSTHPHACLTCNEAEGCSRTQCSQNVDSPERCCSIFGNCELRQVAAYIVIPDYTPRYIHQAMPVIKNQPFYNLDYNLCIACGRCLRVCRDVKEIDVFEYSEEYGHPVAVPKNGTMKESGCIFCGACVEVCPTGALLDKPWEYETKSKSVLPCMASCPAEINVPLYVKLIGEKRYGQSIAAIREKAPIPGILGRVCYSPCETGCRRAVWDEPVAIRSLKRFAADHDDGYWKENINVKPDTGKKIAVVGAGPAGLSASYYLRLLGHQVDLYESMPKPGGMLRYGIPRYRLPEQALDSEINDILSLGVNFHPNRKIDSPESLSDYDSLFWATGVPLGVSLPRGVEENDEVADGLEFLKKVNMGENIRLAGSVGVIGGGNVATDVARTAIRLGADKVTILYRRTRAEMPAYDEEIDASIDEGIEFLFLISPRLIFQRDDGLHASFQKMRLGAEDEKGRRSPEPIPGEFIEMIFDHIFTAIGQKIETALGLEIVDNGVFKINPDYSTPREGIFAGGDNVSGPASVVEAVQAGRKAAISIDIYLGGPGELPSYGIDIDRAPKAAKDIRTPQRKAPCLKIESRRGFDEIEQGYAENAAIAQAHRCARCDLRLSIIPSVLPPDKYSHFDQNSIETVPEEPGVIQLYDREKNIILVSGTENMRLALRGKKDEGFQSAYFAWEPYQMYTQRESEILSAHLQAHGKLPPGNDMDEDLF